MHVLLVEHGLHGYCLFIILPSPSLRLSLPLSLLPPAPPPKRHSLRSEPVAAQVAGLHPTSRRPSSSHLVAARTRVALDFAAPESVLNMHRSHRQNVILGPLCRKFILPYLRNLAHIGAQNLPHSLRRFRVQQRGEIARVIRWVVLLSSRFNLKVGSVNIGVMVDTRNTHHYYRAIDRETVSCVHCTYL